MAGFGKKTKEESINDKMVRLFKEGKSVDEISKELEVKPDVITNVIRRRCGEDSIPETVIRSKNALPQPGEEQPLKADMALPETDEPADQPAEEEAEIPTEGMSKLERMMLEKEKKKQEAAAAAAAQEPESEPEPEEEAISMDGISTEGLDLGFDYETPEEPAAAEPEPFEEPEMEGISAADIPELSAEETIEEQPVASYSDNTEPEPVAEPEAPAAEEAPAETEPAQPAAEAAVFDMPAGVGGSAFDKMKAFAQSQIAANNEKIAELEAKLGSSEGDYTEQLAEAEKTLEESKVAYEEVLGRGDEINEKRMELQAEHRAALARAEEDYRKKLAELDDEYNNATARANKEFSEKEVDINAASDAIDAEKETAKNNFLNNQAAVNDIKKKIGEEVDAVKAQIATLKEENEGYEKFMG